MEDPRGLFFGHGAGLIDLIEEFPIPAILHEDVDLVLLLDDLVDLRDILMQEILLQFYLSLDGFDLVGVVGLQSGDFDCDGFSCQFMNSLFDLPEAALSEDLFCVS